MGTRPFPTFIEAGMGISESVSPVDDWGASAAGRTPVIITPPSMAAATNPNVP